MIRATSLAALCAVILLTVSACGDDGDGSSRPTSASSPTRGDQQSASAAEATCALKGRPSVKVTFRQSGGDLTVTFDGQPVPEHGTILYSVTAFDKSGNNGDQLGMKFQDGKQIGYFVFDFGTSQQSNLDGSVDVSESRVSGTFPADELGRLADSGPATWSAALNVNGDDVASCPGGIESLPFPN